MTMPGHSPKLPATLRRSPPKAQRTYAKTLENAEREYGPGERASRTAMSALKHSFEKAGDHWEPKRRSGSSDSGAKKTVGERGAKGETFGGVDVLGHTRAELYERARKLDIRGRSRMNKDELARAIANRQD
jgi:hypothetical protein